MKKYRLSKRYFIGVFLGLILITVALYVFEIRFAQTYNLWFLYVFFLIIGLLVVFQRNAYIEVNNKFIIRYFGFGDFGKMKIDYKEIEEIKFNRVSKNITIITKSKKIVFSHYFKNYNDLGIFLHKKALESNQHIIFTKDYLDYFS